jgi:hypothetical protein
VKVKEVQKVRLQDYTQNVQAILINPKWRQCDEFISVFKRLSLAAANTAANTGSGSSSQDQPARYQEGEFAEDNDDEETITGRGPKAFKGITMKEFSELVIPKSVMQDGILFIWVEKEYVMEVCKVLEEQQFFYVENMCWVMLDESMKDGRLRNPW